MQAQKDKEREREKEGKSMKPKEQSRWLTGELLCIGAARTYTRARGQFSVNRRGWRDWLGERILSVLLREMFGGERMRGRGG